MDKLPDKILRRALGGIKSMRVEYYTIGKGQAIFVLAMGAAMLAGLAMNLAPALTVRAIGFFAVIVAAFAILTLYAIKRKEGPLNYTTIMYVTESGEPIYFQTAEKGKTLHLGYRGKSVRYRKGNVEEAPLYRDYALPDWYKSASFTSVTNASSSERRYTGTANGKPASLSLKNGALDYAAACRSRLRYTQINSVVPAAVPSAFFVAAARLGLSKSDLPFLTAEQEKTQAAKK